MSSTTYYCSPKANSTNPVLIAKRVFQLFSGFGLSINGKHTFCGDYMYSGHTTILVMSYLIVVECKYLTLYSFLLLKLIIIFFLKTLPDDGIYYIGLHG